MSVASAGERTSARETGPALEAQDRFLLRFVPAVERFPRRRKFLLGDRTRTTALDVLDSLVEATWTRRRGAHLARANVGIEKLRVLFRLAHDLRFLDPRRCGGRAASEGFPSRCPFQKAARGPDFDRAVSQLREIPSVAGDKSRAARRRRRGG